MRKTGVLLCGFVVLLSLRSHSQTSIGTTPSWLKFLGNGESGAFSCTSGNCLVEDEFWVTSFNVSAGATVYSVGDGPLIIRSTGACTIAGEVANSPSFSAAQGLGQGGIGDFGGGGGGGGGGTAAGMSGFWTAGDANAEINVGGIHGAAGGGNGGNAGSPVIPQYRQLLSGGTFWPVGGSIGGQGGSSGGKAGQGGGPVIFVCDSINFTGTINVSGGAGQPAPANNTGAGGGGGGGYAILSADSYVANTGTINVSGGAGGGCNGFTGCGTGGNGGNGWSIVINIQ